MNAKTYETAGVLADEVLTLVRTVIAYATFQKEIKLFTASIRSTITKG